MSFRKKTCNNCKTEKDHQHFSFRNKEHTKSTAFCKKCMKKISRDFAIKSRAEKQINKHYGLTVVLEYTGIKKIGLRHRQFFNVICKCGRRWEVRSDRLKGLKSCGKCLNWIEGAAAFSELYGQYKKRGINSFGYFKLTKEQFKKITKNNCHYCGSRPNNVYKKKHQYGAYTYNGIDRFDNNKGYTIKNCVPCCKYCNYAKRNRTYDEFESWVSKLKNHTKVKSIRKKYFPTRSIFFDVDDTLVMWPKENQDFINNPKAKKFSINGFNFFLLPHYKQIQELKKKYIEGYEIVVWSYGSKEWSEEVITKLNLNQFVDCYLSKPDVYYDDTDVSVFLKNKKRYLPYKK